MVTVARRREAAAVPVLVLLLAFATGSCAHLEQPPASPATSFTPDVVGVVASEADLGCGLRRITLDSGYSAVVPAPSGSAPATASDCPAAQDQVWQAFAPVTFADESIKGKPTLLMTGRDASGRDWFGLAVSGYLCSSESLYAVVADAWIESGGIHLSNGLLLETAPSWAGSLASFSPPPWQPGSWIRTHDSAICVDATGRVVRLSAGGYG